VGARPPTSTQVELPTWTRAPEPSRGATTSMSTRPPAVTTVALPVTRVGRVHLVPVDRQDPVRRAAPCPGRTVVGVHHVQPHALPRTRVDGLRAPAVDGGGPVIGVQQGHDIRAGGVAVPRPDDQRTEQAADDPLVGDLVKVVPVAAGLLRHEPVGELLAGPHGLLGDAGHTVSRVRHVHAVPVQRDAVEHVGVPQVHLEQLALGDL
jgi:hypothetical protein